MTNHSMVYFVSGDSYSDLGALKKAGIIDLHFVIHGGGSSAPSSVVTDCNAAGLSPILNNGNDGSAGWNGSDSYNADLAAQGWHAVGGESEQAAEIDSIMNHLIFLDYGGEGTGGGTNDDVWAATHPASVHNFGCAGYYETYDSATNFWGWDVIGNSLLDCKKHGVKEIGIMVGTWMINHSTAQDYIQLARDMESNGITCAGIGVWGGYGNNANNVYNEFASWFQQWQAIWPPETRTMKQRFGSTPPPANTINFASTPSIGGSGMDIFVKGSDNALWHSPDDGKTWTSLGGNLTSAPSAITRGTGMDVYVRGSPDGVYMKSWNGTAWSTWFNLGGQVLAGTGPAAYFDGTNVTLEAVGVDKALYRKTWNGTVWSGWVAVAKVIK